MTKEEAIKRIEEIKAAALSTLQVENEKLLDENRRWSEATRTLSCAIENLQDELEQVKRERDAAKSPEVLKAVDELMEFERVRMSTADWLYYVDALGGWRGQKEE